MNIEKILLLSVVLALLFCYSKSRATCPEEKSYDTHRLNRNQVTNLGPRHDTAQNEIALYDDKRRDSGVHVNATPDVELSIRWPVSSVAFTPDRNKLASADLTRGVYLWSLKSGKKLWETTLVPAGAVSDEKLSLLFTRDGRQILLASHVRDPRVLDTASGAILRTIGAQGEWFAPAVSIWQRDGTEMAVTSSGGDLHFWNASTGKEAQVLKGAGQNVIALQVAKSAPKIALSLQTVDPEDTSDTGRVLVRELPSGRILVDVRQSRAAVRQVAISPNGDHLLAGSAEGLVCWSTDGRERLWSRNEPCSALAMSPDGKMLIYGSGSRIMLCDVRSGTTLSVTRYGRHIISAAAFSDDGTTIAAGGEDGAIATWTIHTPREQ